MGQKKPHVQVFQNSCDMSCALVKNSKCLLAIWAVVFHLFAFKIRLISISAVRCIILVDENVLEDDQQD